MDRVLYLVTAALMLLLSPAADAARPGKTKLVKPAGKNRVSKVTRRARPAPASKLERNIAKRTAKRLALYKNIRAKLGFRWLSPEAQRYAREGLKAAIRTADAAKIRQLEDIANRGHFDFHERAGLIIGGGVPGIDVEIGTSSPRSRIVTGARSGEVSIEARPIRLRTAEVKEEATRALGTSAHASPRAQKVLRRFAEGKVRGSIKTKNGSIASIWEARTLKGEIRLVGTIKNGDMAEWALDGKNLSGSKGLNLVAD